MLNTLPEAVQDTIRSWYQSGRTPMRKLGVPADLGNAVALLAVASTYSSTANAAGDSPPVPIWVFGFST